MSTLQRRRVGLRIALGVVWLADAALQYQPFMFGRGFVTGVLAPAAAGQPAIVAAPARYADQLIAHNVAAWNAVFATVQLALGLGLLWRRTTKIALAGTIAWALGVWLLAEGAGGLLNGTASPLTGAPGAALLYALLAVLIWPTSSGSGPAAAGATAAGGTAATGAGSVAAASPLGRRGSSLLWLILWTGFAALLLQPATGVPAAGRGLLAAAFVLIGAGILTPRTARAALICGVCAALIIWAAGESFGALFTGQATDPNTGPLLVLLAVAFWPLRGHPAHVTGTVTTAAGTATPDRAAAKTAVTIKYQS